MIKQNQQESSFFLAKSDMAVLFFSSNMTNSESNQSPSPTERPYGVTPGVVKNNKMTMESELWNLDATLPGELVAEGSSSEASTTATGDDAENPIVLVADELPVIEESAGVRVIEEIAITSESEVRQTTRRPRLSARRRREIEVEPESLDTALTEAPANSQAGHHYIPDKSSIIRPHETNIWESLETEENPTTSATTSSPTEQDVWIEDGSSAPTPTGNEAVPPVAEHVAAGDSPAVADPSTTPEPAKVMEALEPMVQTDKSSDNDAPPLAIAPSANVSEAIATPEEVANTVESSSPEISTQNQAFRIPRISHVERVTLIVFAALVVVGGVLGVVGFYRNIPAQVDPYRMPKLPIVGEIVKITDARTYWRAPIRTGADADTTKADTIMLPVVEITIGNCPQPKGAVRLFFRNEHNELVGDPITRAFSDMRFDANGKATLPMASTFGFNDFGAHQAYRAEKALPWKIEVFEGPSESAPRESFKKISTLPISSNQQ